jgi:hypothetical protein
VVAASCLPLCCGGAMEGLSSGFGGAERAKKGETESKRRRSERKELGFQ